MTIMSTLLCVVVSLALATCVAAAGDLVVSKTVTNKYESAMAVGTEYDVEIVIFNVGDEAATEVSSSDDWPMDGMTSFEVTKGDSNHVWDSIEAGAKVSYEYTVKPTKPGEVRGFRAEVEFQGEPDGDVVTVYSNPMNSYRVFDAELFETLTSSRVLEKCVYAAGVALLVVAPAVVYHMTTRKSKSA